MFQTVITTTIIKVKGKVVPVVLTEHHTMRHTGEWRYSSTHSLTSAQDGR
jgi:hypothetical protein